ncbi:DUF2938 domain-containing protein [Salipiger sp. P9]|uniref:DUF2938 domain-containing protein n=1 Tax=Salipiger pentaromativorans TaxID=2943193 RepID=UPI0021577FED|nr:DUF2938 domain-containing protein [Salipiger pentaromativorans]MCR8550086.1 DUF2938 domain-containing protein [Salipiger pentaromativorans]
MLTPAPGLIPLLCSALLLGTGATLVMDLTALFRRRVLGVSGLDYALLGRWLGHLPRGRLIHRPIAASPKIPGERALGWALHYLTGIVFAALFLWIVAPGWLAAPTPLPALGFGLLTLAAPFLVLQPCLGAGLAARNTPNPWRARRGSAVSHLSFGLGLWLTGLAMTSLG